MTGPVVLLDRDGTIIVDRDYLADPAGVMLERHALKGLRRLTRAGATLAVVTNQSGIGRGYFGEDAVRGVNDRVAELLAQGEVCIAGWYICPHAPDQACDCRKPAPGLAVRAGAALGFDPADAYVVGDKASDVGLGTATGATSVLVRTGYGTRTAMTLPAGAAMIVEDLAEAAEQIVAHFRNRQDRH